MQLSWCESDCWEICWVDWVWHRSAVWLFVAWWVFCWNENPPCWNLLTYSSRVTELWFSCEHWISELWWSLSIEKEVIFQLPATEFRLALCFLGLGTGGALLISSRLTFFREVCLSSSAKESICCLLISSWWTLSLCCWWWYLELLLMLLLRNCRVGRCRWTLSTLQTLFKLF